MSMLLAKAGAKRGAKKVGEHISGSIETKQAERQAMSAAIQNPETAPHVVAVEEARTKRTKHRGAYALTALGIVVAGGFVAHHEAVKDAEHLWNALKSTLPKPSIAVQVQESLKSVKLPATMVAVEAQGSGSAKIDAKIGSTAPVLGWVFNHTAGYDTDMQAAASRDGSLQLQVAGSAVHLKGVHTKRGWAAEADVNVAGISADTVNMNYGIDANGNLELSGGDDLLIREIATIGVSTGDAARVGDVTTLADNSFATNCAPVLRGTTAQNSDLELGIARDAQAMLSGASRFEASIGNHHQANLLRQIGSRPVSVVFYENVTSPAGQTVRQTIPSPASIDLHTPGLLANTTFKGKLDMQANVTYDYGEGCTGTPQFMDQQLNLQEQNLLAGVRH